LHVTTRSLSPLATKTTQLWFFVLEFSFIFSRTHIDFCFTFLLQYWAKTSLQHELTRY
jgi:hypothetical protein